MYPKNLVLSRCAGVLYYAAVKGSAVHIGVDDAIWYIQTTFSKERIMRIVGLGGTYRPHSSTEAALRIALNAAHALGAETILLGADALDLPMYRPGAAAHPASPKITQLVEDVRTADGIIIGSPGYHGSISGLVKNALDYLEELREDTRPYLDGRAVGCIATGMGWQATSTTLAALRSVVHALRGWPTPLGVGINTSEASFTPEGACTNAALHAQLELVGQQVVHFALRGKPSAA